MTEKLSNSLQLLQTQTLNQNLIQALTILTLPTYDLESYLEKESESNPLIKITPRSDIRDREERYVSSQSSKKSDSYLSLLENTTCYEKSLYDTLNEQLGFLKLDDNTRFVCKIIISSLDNTGLCPYSKDEILNTEELKKFIPFYDKALDVVKDLEPLGCGSAGPFEAMAHQAKNLLKEGKISEQTFDCVSKLLNDQYFSIINENISKTTLKALDISEDDYLKSVEVIKTLSPYPGFGYTNEQTKYIIPELSIKNNNGTLSINTTNSLPFDVTLDEEYINLLKSDECDKKTKAYIRENKKKAENIIASLAERENTLLALGKTLAIKQYDYFTKGKEFIRSLTLKDVADEINRDESTISRIASSKYIDTDYGIIPVKALFSHRATTSSSGEDISRDRIKYLIKDIIDKRKKDGLKKLSDEKISALLNEQGINISRRTVNKYRSEIERSEV